MKQATTASQDNRFTSPAGEDSYEKLQSDYYDLLHTISNLSQNLLPDGSMKAEDVTYLLKTAYPDGTTNVIESDDLPF